MTVQAETEVHKIARILRPDCAGEAPVVVEQSAEEIGSRVGGGTILVGKSPFSLWRDSVS